MDIRCERHLETAGLINGQKNTITSQNGQKHQLINSNGARQIDSSSLSPVFHGFPSPKTGELAKKYQDIHALYQNSYIDANIIKKIIVSTTSKFRFVDPTSFCAS